MRRTRPDLIVPIRDRRQHRRIITVRNLGMAALIFVLVFVGVTLWSEHGRHGSSDDYGRLFGTQVKATPPPPPRVQPIVHEGQVSDATVADPMLIVPAARVPRAIPTSPSGCAARWYAIGATRTGSETS